MAKKGYSAINERKVFLVLKVGFVFMAVLSFASCLGLKILFDPVAYMKKMESEIPQKDKEIYELNLNMNGFNPINDTSEIPAPSSEATPFEGIWQASKDRVFSRRSDILQSSFIARVQYSFNGNKFIQRRIKNGVALELAGGYFSYTGNKMILYFTDIYSAHDWEWNEMADTFVLGMQPDAKVKYKVEFDYAFVSGILKLENPNDNNGAVPPRGVHDLGILNLDNPKDKQKYTNNDVKSMEYLKTQDVAVFIERYYSPGNHFIIDSTDSDGTAFINFYTEKMGMVRVSPSINGKDIVAIAPQAFLSTQEFSRTEIETTSYSDTYKKVTTKHTVDVKQGEKVVATVNIDRKIESIGIPESVRVIGADAFAGNAYLKYLILPENLTIRRGNDTIHNKIVDFYEQNERQAGRYTIIGGGGRYRGGGGISYSDGPGTYTGMEIGLFTVQYQPLRGDF
jgi:hypothetical protein